ncbi:HK97 family phage prohead protease [Streptomyces carpaticus]|uniref:HK97 family phage prohead protease n=1 Tax=Streptomyces carpaticus TaxID=285558 RepID=UPI0031F8ED1B
MEPMRELMAVRAVAAPAVTRDGDDGAMPLMTVRFAPFGSWYEINSWWEGRYLERVQRGAFTKTISERAGDVKVMFNHGRDFSIGTKLLGSIERLAEEADSPVGDVRLWDTSYNRDLLPGLRAGAYGSSFMFNVLAHHWVEEPERSDHNPESLPERTITEVRLHEFGPVTWPANPAATSGIRSMTDDYYEHLRTSEPGHVSALAERAHRHHPPAAQAPARRTAAAPTTPEEPAARHSRGLTPRQRRERMYPTLTQRGASR